MAEILAITVTPALHTTVFQGQNLDCIHDPLRNGWLDDREIKTISSPNLVRVGRGFELGKASECQRQ